jgi:hypothetical protein
MSEIITKNIICNLKRAHPFIDKIEEVKCREYMKEYISRNNNNKKLKLKFNSKLFIKSLLSNLEYNNIILNYMKKSKPVKKEGNKIELGNNTKNGNGILNAKKFIKNNIRLKKALSYKNLDDEKDNLNGIYNIKSNKKFINNNIEIEKENGNNIEQNRLILSTSNYYKINNNSSQPSKFNNNIENNILPVSARRDSRNKNVKYKTIKSISNSNLGKSCKSIQSNLRGSFINKSAKFIKSNSDINFDYKNVHNINNINESNRVNIFRKINQRKIFKRSSSSKQEYLRFLEKKSLALRANFIMNNIQSSRGGKQDIRALYNPLNV